MSLKNGTPIGKHIIQIKDKKMNKYFDLKLFKIFYWYNPKYRFIYYHYIQDLKKKLKIQRNHKKRIFSISEYIMLAYARTKNVNTIKFLLRKIL